MPTIIVFSHLRWDFVYQRPQQLLTRLAPHFRIVYVEEPLHSDGPPHLTTSTPTPNLTVVQPHTPSHTSGFHDDQIPLLQPLLAALAPAGEEIIAWFYTPMALPLLPTLPARLVVYDCMDELSAFLHAPRQLMQRETALLKIADLVFAGGPSLYNARRARHPNAHCFPSSVDAGHFRQALERGLEHPLQAGIPRPRLGYFGVIDARFDTALLAALADARPDWQLVMVGPVLKIAPASLPRRGNIHYLGRQPYQELPRLVAGWDVCLLPFALNEATCNISPTKVLEYMAAELPVVSTAITDVARAYGGVAAIAHDEAGFIAACEAALTQTPGQRAATAQRMRAIVEQTSWQATADAMRRLIEQAAASRQPPHSPATATQAHTENAERAGNAMRAGARETTKAEMAGKASGAGGAGVTSVTGMTSVAGVAGVAAVAHAGPRGGVHTGCIIIGAGPTGLSAAYHLDADTLLLERAASVGGWCRSIQDHGFTFDHAGHIMFSNDPYVLKLYDILLGDNQHWQMREAWIYSKQVYTRYPFQGSLHGLPPDVIRECIMGAVAARYTAPAPRPANAHCATPVPDCCADGTTDTANTPRALPARPPNNFEDFIHKVWGAGIARHFALPYNRKLWTIPLKEMETSWLGGRVPLPDLDEIVDGALQPTPRPMGPNARFGYPRRGGFQALMSGFLPHIRGKIELNASVTAILPDEHTLMLADGRLLHYDHLISTMPMPELVRLMGNAVPVSLKLAAGALRHVSIRCVNIGVNRPKLTDKHWIYYPEDTVYHRIFVQGNASPDCNPPGGFGFTCEISYSPSKPLPAEGDALIAQCLADCVRTGFLSEDDQVLTANEVDMPYAYVVYDHARAGNVAAIREWMARHDILLAGRYSEWEYYNSDHAFLAGKRAAEHVRAQRSSRTRAAVST
ncbi:NAD(P)-binding protein [Duganella sp. P38]|uniref:NAD(P)-binding protein n=1 Tax=Duganella sp. P38 TaxID=3423949 RepID=UPI003D7B807C